MTESTAPATEPTRTPANGASGWGWPGWLLVTAVFVVGFVNFPLRVVGWNFQYLPGDAIDPRLNNYVLEHGYRYLMGWESSFWDAPMFYPAQAALAGSDAHIGMLPIYAGLRVCGLSPERSFQGWFVIPFLLNYLAAVWALRRLGAGVAGTVAGAFVFTFALPLAGQILHAQLFPRFLVPPIVVFAWEFLREPRTWRFVAVAGCWAAQTYISVYTGYFLALLLPMGFLLVAIRFGRQLPWRELVWPGWWATLARIAAGGAALGAVVFLAHQHARVASPPPDEYLKLNPLLESWVTVPGVSGPLVTPDEIFDRGQRATKFEERHLFPGFVPLAAVTLGLFVVLRPGPLGSRRSAVAVAAWSSVLLALLVTQFGNVWLYQPLTHMPGARGVRAVGRVVLVLLFPAAIVVAAMVDALVSSAWRVGRGFVAIVSALALGVVVGDQWLAPTDGSQATAWRSMQYRLTTALARQQRFADVIRQPPPPTLVFVHQSVLELPPNMSLTHDRVATLQIEVIRACQDLGIPCVNGWSGYLPPGWDLFSGYRDLMKWMTELHQTPPEKVAGLLVIGVPTPDKDLSYDARMREKYPLRTIATPMRP